MTGGQAFVWDPEGKLSGRLNPALVDAALPDTDLLDDLRWRIERHTELTGSVRGQALLEDWDATVSHIWLVAPVDQIRRMEALRASQVAGAV
jgi:glutamate synthase (NADPH/NADH) large chain